jgi:hypothetical protein
MCRFVFGGFERLHVRLLALWRPDQAIVNPPDTLSV